MAPRKKLNDNENSDSPAISRKKSLVGNSQDLAHLNNRFAGYIHRVRQLETENARVSADFESLQQSSGREVANIKELFQRELTEAKNLLDETCKERARLEIDAKHLFDENDNLKEKLHKNVENLREAERHISTLENNRATWQKEYSTAVMEKNKYQQKIQDLEKELTSTKGLLEDSLKNLKDETIRRVDFENRNQTLREELDLRNQIHLQEMSNSRSQIEVSQIDRTLAQHYEAKLEQSLQELRDQYESGLKENRKEVAELYRSKSMNLESQLRRQTEKANQALMDAEETRIHNKELNAKITNLEGCMEKLKNKNKDLERLLEAERVKHSHSMEKMQEEMTKMSEDMEKMGLEYQELMSTKIALDVEISTFRKLLEGEEDRLRITPIRTSKSMERTPPRVPKTKKRRNQNTHGSIEISEADSQEIKKKHSPDDEEDLEESAIVLDEKMPDRCIIM